MAKKRKKKKDVALAQAETQRDQRAAQLAQLVNLHIGGWSLTEIGNALGMSADEVDRLLASESARYVRSQPALRVYVRNWISDKFTSMIEADWEAATSKKDPTKLEHQDRVIRMLDRMARLHGADAPTQTEVKVEAAPEAVEALVNALAAGKGMGYDTDIFDDVIDAEVVHEAAEQNHTAVLDAGERVGEDQPGDKEWGRG